MSDSCVEDVLCRMCGKKGHLRIDCPDQNTISHQQGGDGCQSSSKESKDSPKDEQDGTGSAVVSGKRKICDNSPACLPKLAKFNPGLEALIRSDVLENLIKGTEGDKTVINHDSNLEEVEAEKLTLEETDSLITKMGTSSCNKALKIPAFGVEIEDFKIDGQGKHKVFHQSFVFVFR